MTVTHAVDDASSANEFDPADDVTFTVNVNETGLTVDPTTLALAIQPSGLVTLTATSGDAAVTIDTDATPLARSLTFSTTTWNTAQTVTATRRR